MYVSATAKPAQSTQSVGHSSLGIRHFDAVPRPKIFGYEVAMRWTIFYLSSPILFCYATSCYAPQTHLMYPPTGNLGRYQLLAQDSEHSTDPHALPSSKLLFLRIRLREIFWDLWRRRYFRLIGLIAAILFVGVLSKTYFNSFIDPILWKAENFAFDEQAKPSYLDAHPKSPLVLRLAIMSRVDEFERRKALRETMLNGVFPQDVKLDYRFVVGRADSLWTRLRMSLEVSSHDDMLVLQDLKDVQNRLSEKRYRALEWVRFFTLAIFHTCVESSARPTRYHTMNTITQWPWTLTRFVALVPLRGDSVMITLNSSLGTSPFSLHECYPIWYTSRTLSPTTT